MKIYYVIAFILCGAFSVSGCTNTTAATKLSDYNFNSLLWIQTASEYKAGSIQTYNMATNTIDQAIHDRSWVAPIEHTGSYSLFPVAVVMDIDETVLDNSQYQAELVLHRSEYSHDTWDHWISLKRAPAIPGAVEFINAMDKKGVEVIYITNRECKQRLEGGPVCPQEQDTIKNLKAVGIVNVKPENILLKRERSEWSSEKKSRRESIVLKYRVVMLFGDDLGDFLPGVKKNISAIQRDNLIEKYRDYWGNKWYMLNNPIYGSWLNVLDEPTSKYLKGY